METDFWKLFGTPHANCMENTVLKDKFYYVIWEFSSNNIVEFEKSLDVFKQLTGNRFSDVLTKEPDRVELLVNYAHMTGFAIVVSCVCSSLNDIRLENSNVEIIGQWDSVEPPMIRNDYPSEQIVFCKKEIFNEALEALKEKYGENL